MRLEFEKVLYKNLNRKFNGLTKPREREFRYMHGHFKIRQKSTIRNAGRGILNWTGGIYPKSRR